MAKRTSRETDVIAALRRATAIALKHAALTRERAGVMREVAAAYAQQADGEPDGHWSSVMRRHADAAKMQADALEREARTTDMEADQYSSRADVEATPRPRVEKAQRRAPRERAGPRQAAPRPGRRRA